MDRITNRAVTPLFLPPVAVVGGWFFSGLLTHLGRRWTAAVTPGEFAT